MHNWKKITDNFDSHWCRNQFHSPFMCGNESSDVYVCILCNQVILTDIGSDPEKYLLKWEEFGLIDDCDLTMVNHTMRN